MSRRPVADVETTALETTALETTALEATTLEATTVEARHVHHVVDAPHDDRGRYARARDLHAQSHQARTRSHPTRLTSAANPTAHRVVC